MEDAPLIADFFIWVGKNIGPLVVWMLFTIAAVMSADVFRLIYQRAKGRMKILDPRSDTGWQDKEEQIAELDKLREEATTRLNSSVEQLGVLVISLKKSLDEREAEVESLKARLAKYEPEDEQ